MHSSKNTILVTPIEVNKFTLSTNANSFIFELKQRVYLIPLKRRAILQRKEV